LIAEFLHFLIEGFLVGGIGHIVATINGTMFGILFCSAYDEDPIPKSSRSMLWTNEAGLPRDFRDLKPIKHDIVNVTPRAGPWAEKILYFMLESVGAPRMSYP
jgi:hypothetical protein